LTAKDYPPGKLIALNDPSTDINSCLLYLLWVGHSFGFTQGRLCPTPLNLPSVWTIDGSSGLSCHPNSKTQSQKRRTKPALSEVEGSVRPTICLPDSPNW